MVLVFGLPSLLTSVAFCFQVFFGEKKVFNMASVGQVKVCVKLAQSDAPLVHVLPFCDETNRAAGLSGWWSRRGLLG